MQGMNAWLGINYGRTNNNWCPDTSSREEHHCVIRVFIFVVMRREGSDHSCFSRPSLLPRRRPFEDVWTTTGGDSPISLSDVIIKDTDYKSVRDVTKGKSDSSITELKKDEDESTTLIRNVQRKCVTSTFGVQIRVHMYINRNQTCSFTHTHRH